LRARSKESREWSAIGFEQRRTSARISSTPAHGVFIIDASLTKHLSPLRRTTSKTRNLARLIGTGGITNSGKPNS
jgi:hypothetical protein